MYYDQEGGVRYDDEPSGHDVMMTMIFFFSPLKCLLYAKHSLIQMYIDDLKRKKVNHKNSQQIQMRHSSLN